MNHFPIFVNLSHQHVIVVGGGHAALCKLRLLLKTQAIIRVYAVNALPEIHQWHKQGALALLKRPPIAEEFDGASLLYAACETPEENKYFAEMARTKAVFVNIVDNLCDSDFITPAIVDRTPVVVAIGTEGSAPILARKIKADIEAHLSPILGKIATIAQKFRKQAEILPFGRTRRNFWSEFFDKKGADAYAKGGDNAVITCLNKLLALYKTQNKMEGWIDFIESNSDDVEMLTLKARRALDGADIVLYDHNVAPEILELVRREAHLINIDEKEPNQKKSQAEINHLIRKKASQGYHIVRLKIGAGNIFDALSAEINACEKNRIIWNIIPAALSPATAQTIMRASLPKKTHPLARHFLINNHVHDKKGDRDPHYKHICTTKQNASFSVGKDVDTTLNSKNYA